MNPKHKIIKFLLQPIISFFEQKLRVSGLFAIVILYFLILPFVMRNKSKSYNVIISKVLILLALCLLIIGGIRHTIILRSS